MKSQHLAVGMASIRRGGSLRIRSGRETMRGTVSTTMNPASVRDTAQVPLRLDLVEKLCYFLELRGLDLEGIFRISGNSGEVAELYAKFPLLTEEIDLYGSDPYNVAAALKLYFREQPQPLIPFGMFEPFIDAVALNETDEDRINVLLPLVEALPPSNRGILRRLLVLLEETAKRREVNKMTPENLGVCFGPTLMRPEVENIQTLSRSNYQTLVFSVLISNAGLVQLKIPEARSNYRNFGAPPSLVETDWNLLLATATVALYQQNEIILEQDMENYNLYRIVTGRVRIEKKDKVLGVLGPQDLFGEMSFLGRYEVSARAVAEENNTKVQIIDSSYIQKILSLHPELFAKFYWNLTYNMAKRQQQREREELKSLTPRGTESKKKGFLKANHIVKVIMKDGTSRTFAITDGTNAHGLCRIISNKDKVSHPEKYHLYEFSNDLEHPKQLGNDEVISRKLAAALNDPSFALYYNTTTPSVAKTVVPIKEYQGIGHKNKIGILSIMPNNITFHLKLLGLEKKLVYFYKDLVVGDIQQDTIITLTDVSTSAGKRSTFTFRRVDDCKEACSIIKWAAEKDRIRRKDTKLGNNPKAVANEMIGLASTRTGAGKQFSRAIVARGHNPVRPGELMLRENDVVIVHEKKGEEWVGECNNVVGRFPASCVVEIYEAKETEKLIGEGYRDLQDLPTRTDWKLILMGGFTRKFQQDQVILRRNDRFQSVYQIVSGRCRIEQDNSNGRASTIIRRLGVNELFGDLSFVTAEGATASVVAEEDDTEVYVIPADYLQHIFKRDKVMMGRFFKYLAVVLERRLRVKQPKLEETDDLDTSLSELEAIARDITNLDIEP